MMKFIIISLFFLSSAFANEISDSFKAKDYKRISDIYKKDRKRDYSKKDLIYISFSLRKLGFHRQDIKLNIRLIKKNFAAFHRKLMSDLKKGETIDGEAYPDALKVLYWNLMNDYGRILEGYKRSSFLIKKDHQHYLIFSKLLSELEFRERIVDKFNDQIVAHIQYLENKVYKKSVSLSAQYISWQTSASLNTATSKSGLIITNSGLCLGGDVGMENAFYHFYIDGCAFFGSGGVSSDQSSPFNYQQSNVPAYGLKLGPGASMIVSSSGSSIGLRLPIIYTMQSLQSPANPAFDIKSDSPLSLVGSLYSRWQFKNWYFQTEFGKYLQVEQTYWALGIGKKF